ncbi:hypothetical protein L211DRAFT_838935 [Terfezia boudieri ATCC MYA-4762]|uniref:Uncharacterized protein n=1 Tax=Terfezia boudieri ATCC MYA-4762 TaxID=1051890 RepID=A0A3N4LNA5_9PEZI|nr:hypothetical protein L211DRAFT_838935 [Terfezia boudieri ATCC MYA-4762]
MVHAILKKFLLVFYLQLQTIQLLLGVFNLKEIRRTFRTCTIVFSSPRAPGQP